MIYKRHIYPRQSFHDPALHAQQHAVLFRKNRNPYRKGGWRWQAYEIAFHEALSKLAD